MHAHTGERRAPNSKRARILRCPRRVRSHRLRMRHSTFYRSACGQGRVVQTQIQYDIWHVAAQCHVRLVHVSVCVYVYVCMCWSKPGEGHLHLGIYVLCAFMYIPTHACMHVCIHMCVCVYIYIYIYTCIRCVNVNACTHISLCIPTLMHIHMHTPHAVKRYTHSYL